MQQKRIISLVLAAILASVMFTSNISAKGSIKSKSVVINADEATLAVGDIATLSAIMKPVNSTDKLTWNSSDQSVATVNGYGVVTAVAEGTSVISVTTSSKKTAECKVFVKEFLTKAETEQLVRSELLSDESIKKLITDNTISEEAIKKLIAENTLSEEDVKRLIKENGEGSEAWPDGTEVPMITGQILPILINDPDNSGIIGSIKTIKVTKRRMTTTVYRNKEAIYLPYRYDVIMTAEVPNVTEGQKSGWYAALKLGSPDVAADIASERDEYTASFNGTTLTELAAFYSVYDIDEFFIESSAWKSRNSN